MRQSVKDNPGHMDSSGLLLIKGGAKRKFEDSDLHEEDAKIKLQNSVEDAKRGRTKGKGKGKGRAKAKSKAKASPVSEPVDPPAVMPSPSLPNQTPKPQKRKGQVPGEGEATDPLPKRKSSKGSKKAPVKDL